MNIRSFFKSRILASAGVICAMLAFAAPASAQTVVCPAGYGFSPGYGCVPFSPGYAAVYAPPPPAYESPIYDPLTIALGFGGGHGHYDHRNRRDYHGHPHDDHGQHR